MINSAMKPSGWKGSDLAMKSLAIGEFGFSSVMKFLAIGKD